MYSSYDMDNSNAIIVDIPKRLDSTSIVPVISQINRYEQANNPKRLVINFSQTNFVKPGGLTPLLVYLMELPTRIPDINGLIVPSMNANVDLYISRMGFYSLLGMKDDFPYHKHTSKGRFQELYSFSNNTDINEVAQTSENIIKMFIKDRTLTNYNKAIGWCVFETIDNARNHASSDINVIFAQRFEQQGITEFCVCDRGLGIRKTMGEDNIEEALKKCITKARGINSEGMGNGLYYTSELIKKDSSDKCSLKIWSEDAILTIKSGHEPEIIKTGSFWNGVNIVISMYNKITSDLTVLKGGNDIFSYEENPDYYNKLFED